MLSINPHKSWQSLFTYQMWNLEYISKQWFEMGKKLIRWLTDQPKLCQILKSYFKYYYQTYDS